ncbi:MAG: TIGR03915 family putative DNA repair protein [Lachnospiraceae bacterium]|nr:TIGR03915 family putative DNA repair protein [Lachnospiraceae bacterium]
MAYVYRCEDTLEGIFTAIYNIYRDRHNLPDTRIALEDEYQLFAEYIWVETEPESAVKVMRTCQEKFGERDYYGLSMALMTQDLEKAQAVYKTIAYGLSAKTQRGHLFDHLTDDYVLKAFKLSATANREAHHWVEFLRFRELENGILYAVIAPKCNVMTELMEHFSDRLPSENFAIFDEKRKLFGIHPYRKQWFLATGDELEEHFQDVKYSAAEEKYAELFRHFCKTIAIKERKNTDLQRNMLPLYFREFMTEFA